VGNHLSDRPLSPVVLLLGNPVHIRLRSPLTARRLNLHYYHLASLVDNRLFNRRVRQVLFQRSNHLLTRQVNQRHLQRHNLPVIPLDIQQSRRVLLRQHHQPCSLQLAPLLFLRLNQVARLLGDPPQRRRQNLQRNLLLLLLVLLHLSQLNSQHQRFELL